MTSEIKQILQEIDIRPDATENESGSKAVFVLLQLVERLNQENEILKIENQKLRDEVNLLKGEQGKPNVRGNKKGDQGNVSSESERKQREKKGERKPKTKKDKIKIDRSEICKVDQSELPNDAEFKGYESIVVQEILITTDNVEYKKEKYYSPSENKTYLGKVPIGS
jgi:regulator of replication initiation timing